jgi:hypothetical protein
LGVVGRSEDHFLLATSQFKLMSVPAQAMLLAQEASSEGIKELLALEKTDFVSAATAWQPAEINRRYVCLVTKYGQGRAFEARLLAEQIVKMPYFQLERRYTGIPAAVLMAGEDDWVLIGTNQGRISRAAPRSMAIVVHDLIKTRKGEELTAAGIFPMEAAVLALSAQGELLSVAPESLPADEALAQRGVFLRRNFAILDFLNPLEALQGDLFGLTSQGRVLRLAMTEAQLNGLDAGKPGRAFKLKPGECLLACAHRH